MYHEINNIAYINGCHGIYDGKIKNDSVRYARNAVDNYKQTYSTDAEWMKQKMPKLEFPKKIDEDTFEFSMKKIDEQVDKTKEFLESSNFPPAQFNMKYAKIEPGKPDKMAVMAAAYEELGKNTSISTDELTSQIQEAGFANTLISADSLDLNSDGKIDLAEYGSSILVEDMLSSSDSDELKSKDITGEINDKGQVKLMTFAAIQNYNEAKETYQDVYNAFDLGNAQKEFLKDKNNLI